jgi:hypothetical protein
MTYFAKCLICDSKMFAISESEFYENKYTCSDCWE